MTATSRAPGRPRVPPPTPIRTARGARSAAAGELVLAEFLEASLRVPDLTLPRKKGFHLPELPLAPDVPAKALLSGEAAAARTAVGAAAEAGAFRVGGAVEDSEVRAAEEAAEAVFASPEEVKLELRRWFRRRDRMVGEELYWFRPVSLDVDRVLDAALPDSTYKVYVQGEDGDCCIENGGSCKMCRQSSIQQCQES